MNEMVTHCAGNITNDPTMRISAKGTPYAYFTVAQNVRRQVEGGQFVDVATNFVDVRVFGARLASNVATSLRRGDPVHLQGEISQGEFVTKDGEVVRRLQMIAKHVGHDLLWGTTRFTKVVHTTAPDTDAPTDPATGSAPFDRPSASGESPAPYDDLDLAPEPPEDLSYTMAGSVSGPLAAS